jgi:prepilin-type N-terminal cleavage/methylation domain-containing protein
MPRDPRGFTLLELLISAVILPIILLAVYLMYEANQATYLKGESRTDLQQHARIGMDRMETEIRIAGYGVPIATTPATLRPITDATETSITFLADLEDASTTLRAAAGVAATSLAVVSAAGLKVGDSIYVTDALQWQQVAVEDVNREANTLALRSALTGAYPAGSQVMRPKTIRYSLLCDIPPCPPNAFTLKRDGGSGQLQPLAARIASLVFTYYDAANAPIPPATFPARLGDIRRIGIALGASGGIGGPAPESYLLRSEVRPRNLGL